MAVGRKHSSTNMGLDTSTEISSCSSVTLNVTFFDQKKKEKKKKKAVFVHRKCL